MKKLIILGAANPNIIRTIDRINSKTNQEIIVECFVDNDNKKIGKTFMSKDVLDTQTFLKKYNKDDCLLFNSIASSMQERKEITEFYIKKGYNFKSNTDTEVILAAYVEWGEECQFKFNGMWSFAIWDSSKRNLFISRDRFGIKPLFYIHTKDYFIFASELKAFKFLTGRKSPDFNFKMIANMGNIENSTETILNGVSNLNGGFQINVESSGNLKVKKWWRTKDHINYQSFSDEEYIDQYKELFFDSCKIRMRSDVSLGTALSGGLDSSAVHCAMGHLNKTNAISNRSPSDWQKAFILNYSNTTH